MTFGQQISNYSTGLGAVTNPSADGAATPDSPLSYTILTSTVLIHGKLATVTFSALTPGSVGLDQINVVVPADTPAGSAVPLLMTDGQGTYSNTVFFAVGSGASGNSAELSKSAQRKDR